MKLHSGNAVTPVTNGLIILDNNKHLHHFQKNDCHNWFDLLEYKKDFPSLHDSSQAHLESSTLPKIRLLKIFKLMTQNAYWQLHILHIAQLQQVCYM